MMYKRQPLIGFDPKKSFSPLEQNGFFIDHENVLFKPTETKFSFENAWWLAECSRLAYVDVKIKKRKYLKSAGFPNVTFFDNQGSEAFVAYNDDTIIVSFTGTQLDGSTEDILVDLQFWPSAWDDGEGLVHSGFERGFLYIWPQIVKHIKPLMETRSLWYTGHSLGAALATLAASALEAQGCYTFGSPRVGNRKFSKGLKCPVYRVAKSRDIVTRVPTPPIYHHVGQFYFIKNDEGIILNPTWITMFYERLGGDEWKILFLLIKAIVFRNVTDFVLDYLHDHSPYNYSVYIWNNINTVEKESKTNES